MTLLATGPEFRINAEHPNARENLELIRLSNGNLLATYTAYIESGGPDVDIFGQILDPDGQAIGSEFRINTFTTGAQQRARTTALDDGGFVVAWNSFEQDGSFYGVYAQRYAADGTRVGAEFRVNTTTESSQSQPYLLALPDGGYLITWSGLTQDAGEQGVSAQRYDATGAAVGGEFRVTGSNPDNQTQSSLALLSNGQVLITWQSGPSGNADNPDWVDIFARFYDPATGQMGPEFIVNTYTHNLQSNPVVAPLSNGGFVIVWRGAYHQDGDAGGLFAQIFDATGTPVGTEFQANPIGNGHQFDHGVTGLSDGGFFVAWAQQATGSNAAGGDVMRSESGAYGQRYDAVGTAVGAQVQLSQDTDFTPRSVRATELANGDLAVGWTDPVGASGPKVVGRIFAVGSPPTGEVTIQGLAQQGQVLTAENTLADADGLGTLTYQWMRDGTEIPGATSRSYTLAQEDVGFAVSVRISYTDDEGFDEAVTSQQTASVTNINDAPTGTPVIQGNADYVTEFSVDTSALADADGLGMFAYQWFRDGNPIPLAEQATYVPTRTDRGTSLTVEVGYVDGFGTRETVRSDPVLFNQSAQPVGTPRNFGDEFVISSDHHNSQDEQEVAVLDNGNIIVVWQSLTQDGSGSGVYGQLLSPTGQKIGGEFRVNDITLGNQELNGVAALADGGFVVMFDVSFFIDGPPQGVYGQFYTSDGARRGDNFTIFDGPISNTHQEYPGNEVAALTGGGFVATWRVAFGLPSAQLGVYTRTFDASGAPTSNVTIDHDQQKPFVVGTLDGGFMRFFWVARDFPTPARIMGQRYDQDGTALNSAFPIHQTNGFINISADVGEIAATVLEDGRIVVVWADDRFDGNRHEVRGQILSPTGELEGGNFLLHAPDPEYQFTPDVAALPGGGFIAVWNDDAAIGSSLHAENNVTAQLFDADGVPSGDAFLVSQTVTVQGSNPTIAVSGSNLLAVYSNAFLSTSSNVTGRSFQIPQPGADPMILGTDGSEGLNGTGAAEVINALGGADWINPGDGADTIDGGDGFDMVSFSNQSVAPGWSNETFLLDLDLEAGTARIHGVETNQLTNVERVTGTIYSDLMRGDAGDNQLRGLGNYDWFIATTGNDTLDGGTGRDMVSYLEAEARASTAVQDVFSSVAPPVGDVAGIVVDLNNLANNRGLAAGHEYVSIERITGSS
ncbi:MAG: hypothetical protein MRY81_18295, partial [Donghicola eburneus]|nr:hypothetical protein [Donghicola eburneus]